MQLVFRFFIAVAVGRHDIPCGRHGLWPSWYRLPIGKTQMYCVVLTVDCRNTVCRNSVCFPVIFCSGEHVSLKISITVHTRSDELQEYVLWNAVSVPLPR